MERTKMSHEKKTVLGYNHVWWIGVAAGILQISKIWCGEKWQ